MHRYAKVIGILVILLIFLGVAGVAYWLVSTPSATVPTTGNHQKITIGNVGEFSLFNILAKEKGFFVQHGLDAIVVEYASGPASVGDLLAGKVDVAVAAEFVGVNTIFKSPDLRVLAEVSKHFTFSLVARIDHGIQSPADLKGKTIGVTQKGAGEFYLGRFLTFNTISLSDVRIVNLSPTDMAVRLEEGSIDAVALFDPHVYNLKKNLGNKVVVWSIQNDRKTFALVYSIKDYLGAHSDVARRYLAALLDAEQYIKKYPEESKSLLVNSLGYSREYVDYNWSHLNHALGLDQELLLSMEDQSKWLIDHQLTDRKKVPNYLDFIYFDGLEEVKPESINIIR